MGLSVCRGLVVSAPFFALAKFHPLNEKNAEGETSDFLMVLITWLYQTQKIRVS